MTRTLLIGGLAALTLAGGGAALAQQVPQDPPRAARGDRDGDGRISKAEFVDGRVARLAAQDADGDGTVSAAEMQAGREARRAEGADRAFARMDSDGN
ncbi:MAG: EF-hand domain-containing protein, partial [Alphaproteobacteria bacterium]|nr:EF-hand domain-containing protein [Alphaproteobacteria bacterium]